MILSYNRLCYNNYFQIAVNYFKIVIIILFTQVNNYAIILMIAYKRRKTNVCKR